MPSPPSEDSVQLFKLLADGRWHRYLDVRDKLALKVAPGRALRKYDERLKHLRVTRNDPKYQTANSEDDRIMYGARMCAQQCITSWKERKRGLEQRGSGNGREIRVEPGFRSAGLTDGWPEVLPAESEGSESSPVGEVGVEDSGSSGGLSGVPAGDVLPAVVRERFGELPESERPVRLGEPAGSGLPERLREVRDFYDTTDTSEQLAASMASVTEGEVPEGFTPVVACPVCGVPVLDLAVHEAWHVSQVRVQEQILNAKFEVTLSGEPLDKQLDRFQDNMQEWMAMQFAQLEMVLRVWMKAQDRWVGGSGVVRNSDV